MKIDALDRKILAVLDVEARLSISDISRRVRHGRDIVNYRIERLFSEQVLLGTHAVVNPYCLGLTLYKTYLRLKNNAKRIKALLSRLNSDPVIFCIALCDGAWDIVFNTLARSPAQFSAIQDVLLTEFQDIVIEFEAAIIVEQVLSQRGYFGARERHTFTIGGEPEVLHIDALQLEILNLLVKNARLSISELARETNSTPAIIQTRLEHMEKSKLILGYRAAPNLNALGLTNFKTQLFLKSYASPDVAELKKFVVAHPFVYKVISQIGNSKIELGIEANSYEHFNLLSQELRSHFPELIVNMSTILVREETYRWINKQIDISPREHSKKSKPG